MIQAAFAAMTIKQKPDNNMDCNRKTYESPSVAEVYVCPEGGFATSTKIVDESTIGDYDKIVEETW